MSQGLDQYLLVTNVDSDCELHITVYGLCNHLSCTIYAYITIWFILFSLLDFMYVSFCLF